MKNIILISAKAQHGKDIFAELLKNKLVSKENKVIIDHFAKYIKGYLKDYYEKDTTIKDEFTRTKLQILGTEIIKEKLNYKSFHAKRLTEDFQIVQDDFDCFLVPDTRFPDEIYLFKAMFPNQVTTVRIYRDGVIGGLTNEQLKHKSEIALDDFSFDWIVNNNGTLEDLEKEVELFIQYLNL